MKVPLELEKSEQLATGNMYTAKERARAHHIFTPSSLQVSARLATPSQAGSFGDSGNVVTIVLEEVSQMKRYTHLVLQAG